MTRETLAKLLKAAGYKVDLLAGGLRAENLKGAAVCIRWLEGDEPPTPDQIWNLYSEHDNTICIVPIAWLGGCYGPSMPLWFRMLHDAHEDRVYVADLEPEELLWVYHLRDATILSRHGPLPNECLTTFRADGRRSARFSDGNWWAGWQPHRRPPNAYYTPDPTYFRGDDPYIRWHFENDPRTGREWSESTYASTSSAQAFERQRLEEMLRKLNEQFRADFQTRAEAAWTPGPNPASPGGTPPPKRRSHLANHYDTVGAPDGADFKTVQKAYRQRAKALHPDVNKSADAEQKMLALNLAYQALEKALK